jgi:hypothetical protein
MRQYMGSVLSRSPRILAKRLSEFKMIGLELPEQDARYSPNEPELAILIPHLVEYFKHPPCVKACSDEIVRSIVQLAQANRMKWTRYQV